jgi:hypothetical protein
MKFLLLGVAAILASESTMAKEVTSRKLTADQEKMEERSSTIGTIKRKFTPKWDKNEAVGQILEGVLEKVHFAHKEVDDDLSKEAFKMYWEKID